MRKSDLVLIIIIIIFNTLFLYKIFPKTGTNFANVYYENNLIMEIDLSVDETYSVDGTNGDVEITVKNGKVAITKETSPLNICSKQGYVDVGQIPLICLPNKVSVEGEFSDVDGVAR